jgi:hypothetical protein
MTLPFKKQKEVMRPQNGPTGSSKALKQSTALVVVNYHKAVLRVVESAWARPHLSRGQIHKLTARADIRCRCVLILVSL